MSFSPAQMIVFVYILLGFVSLIGVIELLMRNDVYNIFRRVFVSSSLGKWKTDILVFAFWPLVVFYFLFIMSSVICFKDYYWDLDNLEPI